MNRNSFSVPNKFTEKHQYYILDSEGLLTTYREEWDRIEKLASSKKRFDSYNHSGKFSGRSSRQSSVSYGPAQELQSFQSHRSRFPNIKPIARRPQSFRNTSSIYGSSSMNREIHSPMGKKSQQVCAKKTIFLN